MERSNKERLVKCPNCQQSFPKSETVEKGKRYYCKPCYEIKSAPKPRTDWDELYDTIKHFYGAVTPLMFKQLKQYREDSAYKFTNTGMRLTLVYYHEVLGKPVLEEHQTLGIIPYIYEDAKRYYIEIYRLSQVAANHSFEAPEQTFQSNTKGRAEKVKAFDFNTIDWEEEAEC